MTRHTIPRDAVIRHIAHGEAAVETLRAILDGPDEEAAIVLRLCRSALDRLEASLTALAGVVEGKAETVPVKRGRPRRAAEPSVVQGVNENGETTG